MKRLLLLVLLLGFGFYVAWPAWSGYSIKTALDSGDAATLRNKIDFVSVRESLRPAARFHAEKMMTEALQDSNSPVATVLDDRTKAALLPKIVDQSLDRVVTPENLIRIAAQGGEAKNVIAKIIKEQMGGALGGLSGLGNLGKVQIGGDNGEPKRELDIGGLVGGIVGAATGNKKGLGNLFGGSDDAKETPAPVAAADTEVDKPKKKRKIGIGNVKSVGFAGPLGLQVGVAQDASAKEPDLTAEMGFRDMDWKLVALRPRF